MQGLTDDRVDAVFIASGEGGDVRRSPDHQ